MAENFSIVSIQVLVLFVLIVLGFICGKAGLIKDNGARQMTDVVLYLVTPAIIIKSFQDVEYNSDMLRNLITAAVCALLIQGLSIIFCRLIFRSKNENRRKVMQFAAIFSNCGFVSLPLQNAVLGSEGVFYGSLFVAVFNILVWSYGIWDMSGDKARFSPKNIILNPGVLGTVIAALLFFAKIHLPEIILKPIDYISALNTPLPMLIIGFYLSQTDFKKYVRDLGVYAVSLVRLGVIPAVSLIAMKLCGVNSEILIACTIAASAPSAATSTMFAGKFGRDVDLSVGLVSVTAVFSVLTMPVIIALSQSI